MATPTCAARSRFRLLPRVSTPRVASVTIAAGVACTARVVVMSAASFEIEKASSIVVKHFRKLECSPPRRAASIIISSLTDFKISSTVHGGVL